jgi:hypothetical protein
MSTLKKTLEQLRSDIQIRLGFGGAGSAAVVNTPIIDSFIRNAQEQLYIQHEWKELTTYEDIETGINQQFYDYPSDCNIERILSISILDGETWHPMSEGIAMNMRSDLTTGRPRRFDRFAQMEVWPPADRGYTMRRYYVKALPNLTLDSDRVLIDEALVFLHALTNAKLHYRQPDAQAYSTQLNAMMLRLREKNRPNVPIRRNDSQGYWDLQSPPRVVGRDA